jgi:hypothetical protein
MKRSPSNLPKKRGAKPASTGAKPKKSSVGHTRAVQRDQSKRQNAIAKAKRPKSLDSVRLLTNQLKS